MLGSLQLGALQLGQGPSASVDAAEADLIVRLDAYTTTVTVPALHGVVVVPVFTEVVTL